MSADGKIYNFMGLRKVLAAISIALMLASVASLAVNGLRFGLDFTGGSLVEVGYQESANLGQIREQLVKAGYLDAVVQTFGSSTDVLIRLGETHDPKLGDKIVEALKVDGAELELRRNEYVGAQVGEELREQGGLGMLLALGMIMIYLAFRFQFKFSLGAVLALVHDVTIVLGFFSIMQLDFDLTVLAAVLAVIGYSLNDTIVVYDRIRENFRIMRTDNTVEVMNSSLSQTLSRTIVTSLTTALVLVALLVFGGETIRGFSIALLAGIVIGTYSSIYVAANLLLALNVSRDDLIPPPKENVEIDEMP
ncbi:protein translocase subunit SecF [Marinobacterium sp. LSUCC0821]|uniref:protein translocase subunit SecF n=1 Tax=Marinobacterium sp. LSUCC0821 TaxID=2668067 RepID=UPI0014512F30|nr:protein translocase subunit SecF [Marinobacterium sp. LSUCC0821]QJD72284.1 protein translocase subunit SecF [Marinobacterium sp. LSUCC0821]